MRIILAAVALASIASCGQRSPVPSDERFLAEREQVAARLAALFEDAETRIAPDPDPGLGGYPTRAAYVGGSPDPRPFAAAGKVVLPAPTARLASCGAATEAALAAFAAITGEPLGEGMMGGRGLSGDQRYEEAIRQEDTLRAAYCLWARATRICRDEASAGGRPAPAEFAPRFLACEAR